MHSAPAGLGVLGVYAAPFTDQHIARLRAFYLRYMTGAVSEKRAPAQADWWDRACSDVDRRFMCRIAAMPAELAEKKSAALTAGELLTLFDAFYRLKQWCDARSRLGARQKALSTEVQS